VIYDLLNRDKKIEQSDKRITHEKFTKISLPNIEKAMNTICTYDFKPTDKTKSHIVYVFAFTYENQQKESVNSTITFYELAGSENIVKARNENGKSKPGQENVYKSLVSFNNTIQKLSTNSKGFINYKDSRLLLQLQQVLQSAGSNNSNKIFIICTISQNPGCYQDTMATLLFATRAKAIKSFETTNTNNLSSIKSSSKKVDEVHFKNIKSCSNFNVSSFLPQVQDPATDQLQANKNNKSIEGKINSQNNMYSIIFLFF